MVDRTRTLRYFVRCNEQISLIANNSAVVTAEFTEINNNSSVVTDEMGPELLKALPHKEELQRVYEESSKKEEVE